MAERKIPARKPVSDAAKPAAKAAEPVKPAMAEAALKPVKSAPVATPASVAEAAPAAKPAPKVQARALPRPVAPKPTPRPAMARVPVKISAVKPVKTPIEGLKKMASTAETVTTETNAKLQGAYADVQGRAKSAMEKGAKFYEEMGDFTKGNVEAVIASSRVAASAMESLGQDAAAYGKKSLEHAQATFKSATAVKSPTELFQLQSDYARAAFDALIAQGSAMTEKMMKLTGEVVQPISSRFAVAAEKVKSNAL